MPSTYLLRLGEIVSMTDWVLVLVSFSIITTVKEVKYSRAGNSTVSAFYDLLAFLLMAAAVLLAWHNFPLSCVL